MGETISVQLAILADTLLNLVAVTETSHRLFWVYILTFLAFSCVIYLIRKPADRSLFSFLFPKDLYANVSARTDVKIYLINGLLGGVLNLATLIVSNMIIADATTSMLEYITGRGPLALETNALSTTAFSLAFVLSLDLGLFVAHYLHHKVPFLWNFHKTHHSAEVLTPITAFRFHPVELVLSGLVVALISGPFIGMDQYLHDRDLLAANPVIYVMLLTAFLLTANFRHSHVQLHYPRRLSAWFVSPAMHNLHHSKKPAHFDKNLGFMFSFWDRVANTFFLPEKSELLEFGIGNDEEKKFRSATACYILPLKQSGTLAMGTLKHLKATVSRWIQRLTGLDTP